MFRRMIDNFRDSAAGAVQLTSLAAITALTLLVAASFLCAAAFVFMLQKYGPVEACLAGAAFFFVVAVIVAVIYVVRKNRIKARAAAAAKAAAQSPFADPMLAALAIQVIRAVGVKKMIPFLAVGGLVLGLMAGRSAARASRDDPDDAAAE